MLFNDNEFDMAEPPDGADNWADAWGFEAHAAMLTLEELADAPIESENMGATIFAQMQALKARLTRLTNSLDAVVPLN